MRSSVPSGSKFGGVGWRRLFGQWRPEPAIIFGGRGGFRTVQPGPEGEAEALTRLLIAAESDDRIDIVAAIESASEPARLLTAEAQRKRLSEIGIE
jgi:hypothetical protein